MAAPVFLAMAAAGTALSIYGQIKEAEAREEAARRDAAFKGLQANELLERQAINERILLDQSRREIRSYQARFAGTGREGGGIGGALQIQTDTLEAIQNTRRDAEFKAKMLRIGAESDTNLASDLMTSGYIGAAGTLLASGSSMYSKNSEHGYNTKPPKKLNYAGDK